MSWIPKNTAVAPQMPAPHRILQDLRQANVSPQSVMIASFVSVIAAFLVLMLLRPPIVVWRSKGHETPRLKLGALVAWAIVAGLATMFLSFVL